MSICGSIFRPLVALPTYNNARTLLDVLRRVEALGLPIIVVNDGATDATAELLAQWLAAPHAVAVQVLTHPTNRGKAAALHTAFAAAEAAGFTHVATIDTDGQLDPEDLPALLAQARAKPRRMVMGVRDDLKPDYPSRSRFGRRFSNALIRLECGVRVSDSQCGLRVYPLELLRAAPCRTARFGFESEIITRSAWAGYRPVEVVVNCRYFPGELRVSHFDPRRDSLRIVAMHARLLGRAMATWPWRVGSRSEGEPPQRTQRSQSRADQTDSELFSVSSVVSTSSPPSLWRRFLAWISPAQLWRLVRDRAAGQTEVAVGLAVGVFAANLPCYGAQALLAALAARLLRVHPLPAVLGSQVSTPPLGGLLIAAAMGLGHRLLHGQWLPSYAVLRARGGLALGDVLLEWTIGALLLGLVMAAATFALAKVVFWMLPGIPRTPATHPPAQT